MALSDEEKKERQRARQREYMRKRNAENPEANRAKVRAWRKANPDKRRAQASRDAARAFDRDPKKFRERARARKAAMTPEQRKALSGEAWEWQKKHPTAYLLFNARYRARRDGLPFEIEREDIVIPELCPVLGIPIAPAFGRSKRANKDHSPSLDRIVPELGYVRGNIMVISNRANSLKRDSTDPAEHRAIADYIERETARVRHELG